MSHRVPFYLPPPLFWEFSPPYVSGQPSPPGKKQGTTLLPEALLGLLSGPRG